jgi:hypothetical protein
MDEYGETLEFICGTVTPTTKPEATPPKPEATPRKPEATPTKTKLGAPPMVDKTTVHITTETRLPKTTTQDFQSTFESTVAATSPTMDNLTYEISAIGYGLQNDSFDNLLRIICERNQYEYHDCQFRLILLFLLIICAILLIFGCCLLYLLCQHNTIDKHNHIYPTNQQLETQARLTAAKRNNSDHYLPPIECPATDIPMTILPPYNINLDNFAKQIQIGNFVGCSTSSTVENDQPVYAEIDPSTKRSNRASTPPPPAQHPSYVEPCVYDNVDENLSDCSLPEPPLMPMVT